MLVEFVTCGDCKCRDCQRNISCPKTDTIDNCCIDCYGVPPYAPYDANEKTLYKYECDEKLNSFKL